ncbi:hypothetical protein S40285_03162 [Stachybotrys chlorohalonatus IBT 40285]|uniref:DUF803 domain membrane protein n=1 Tax=Stachybotrys chlorohalonatus (strain IBT 40285) TaxID=1283841 RepID=A0A084QI79_STAC4|nr:hypothetical protein S40285_03162 [Stachybotrys chlorohalonata IBT 40285]
MDTGPSDDRPPVYRAIGIGLAIGSGVFIGVSFVLKKVGLLKANEKYNEVAGEGYGYLKNSYWWGGMILMIIGEVCNFIAYAFVDAILVTPLGALSVVITTILSAIFLKERLSMVGKVGCFLCIVGSVVIVMNAPQSSSVRDIQEMQRYVVTPGFLTYAGIIIVGSIIAAFYAGPRWGSRNMLVYISICSWVGGLSVVATQGLGAAIIAWIGGRPQYREWFLWVLFVFVIGTLLTEIIFLNVCYSTLLAPFSAELSLLILLQKALNIFNAALVTPTYYVYFTSTTIITSAILFQGFNGTVESIITVVLGFLTICSGVVLLQLSKSAKDVPDTAVFTGDLDQIQTIAEQEQPETEPKADAIRGTAAIVRRISQARDQMEARELRRLHEEKMREAMEPITEDGQAQYEWDGLRRRRTFTVSTSGSHRTRPVTSPPPPVPQVRSPHPPLGMAYFPSDEEEEDDDDNDGSTFISSIIGTRRARSRTNATMPTYREEYTGGQGGRPLPPVPLTEISTSRDHAAEGLAPPLEAPYGRYDTKYNRDFGKDKEALHQELRSPSPDDIPPAPPPHSARRQFSFQKVFRREPGASEEERVGLVKEPSRGSDRKEPGAGSDSFV